MKRAEASTRQMGGKPLDRGEGGARGTEQVEHLREEAAPRDGEPVRGHLSGGVAITQRQRVLEALLHTARKGAAGMIDLE